MSRRSHGPARPERLAALIREVLSQTLVVHSRDAVLRRAVLTDVRVTGDLQIAKVYYLALDEQTPREELAAAFRRSAGFLRTTVGQHLTLRHTPELRFLYDEGTLQGRRIEALLRDVAPAADSAPTAAVSPAAEAPPAPPEDGEDTP